MSSVSLPKGWVNAAIGQLVGHDGVFVDGDWVESKDQDPEGDVRLIQLADVGDGEFRDRSARFLTTAKAHELGCTFLEKGDMLIARMPDPLGRCCIFPLDAKAANVTVVDVCIVRVGSAPIANKYLMYAINSADIRNKISDLQSGSTRKRISRGNLATIELPVAPLNEQRRIVAKIEELFSELDKGVESLTTAREQLKAYRQSVLKAAFEGRLTECWRAERANELGDAQSIRAELLAARKELWSNAVAYRRGPYVQPQPFDGEDVPEKPIAWALVSMDELCQHITSGSRGWSQFYDRGESVFIMAQNVRPGRFDPENIQIIDPPTDTAEAHRTRTQRFDLLVTIVGANTGDVCLFPLESNNYYVCQSVALMRPAKIEYAEFLQRYFEARHGGQRQYRRYIYGAGRPHLSFEQLRQTLVPLPTVAEAREIVRLLEDKLEATNVMEAEIEAGLARAEALRQSILKRAFSGQLVAQDAADEPASALLERIRAEREEGGATKRRNNKDNKKEAA